MLNKFLFNRTASMPCRLIKSAGQAHQEQYYLGRLFGRSFSLVRFVGDAPTMPFCNGEFSTGFFLVLSGFYVEERVVDLCPHAAVSGCAVELAVCRWFGRADGNSFRRVTSAAAGTWALFVHGERAKVSGQEKGWGCLRALDRSVMFEPLPPTPAEWWKTAPKGSDAGRVGL